MIIAKINPMINTNRRLFLNISRLYIIEKINNSMKPKTGIKIRVLLYVACKNLLSKSAIKAANK
ncbi:hypothetical protein [Pontimicrobium sp. MEBiC06410]